MEFVEWRKGVASQVYKDLETQEHIEKEVARVKSRHESILEKFRVQIQEMAEKNCALEHEIAMLKLENKKGKQDDPDRTLLVKINVL